MIHSERKFLLVYAVGVHFKKEPENASGFLGHNVVVVVVEQDFMITINAVLLLPVSLVGTNGYCQIMKTTNILNVIQWP
jgi:hypothetical protein